MHNLFTLIIVLAFVYFIRKTTKESISSISLFTALATKLIATIGVWYVYTYYYSDIKLNDIHKYFNDGYFLNQSYKSAPFETLKFILTNKTTPEISELTDKLLFWTKPNQYGLLNDNQTIILINFLLCFITNDNLLLQSILISILSFYVTYKLYTQVTYHFKTSNKIIFILLFFNPSYLIWTSGNFKETFIYIGLFFLFLNLLKLIFKADSLKTHIFILFNLILILFCKNYVFILLFPGVCGIYLGKYLFIKYKTAIISILYTLFLSLFILEGLFYNPVNFDNNIKNPEQQKLFFKKINSKSYNQNALGTNRNVFEILRFKQRDQQFEAKSQKAKTVIYSPTLDGNPATILKCIPYSIANTIFRPNLIDLKNPLLLPDCITTIILWILIFTAIFWKKPNQPITEKKFIIVILFFVILNLIILGILVPVLGNLIRYRAPILPLLMLALALKIDYSKIPLWNKL